MNKYDTIFKYYVVPDKLKESKLASVAGMGLITLGIWVLIAIAIMIK